MTPEERYELCSHCIIDTTRYCHSNCHHYSKYVGAMEQKAEDDKECETMVGNAVKECKQVVIDKACRWLVEHSYNSETSDGITLTSVFSDGTLTQAFRKAMGAEIKESLTPAYDADYLQSKIDAFSEARRKDGKTADEMLDDCRGGALELTWMDMQKIADIIGHTPRLTRDGMTRSPEDFYSEILKRFKEQD